MGEEGAAGGSPAPARLAPVGGQLHTARVQLTPLALRDLESCMRTLMVSRGWLKRLAFLLLVGARILLYTPHERLGKTGDTTRDEVGGEGDLLLLAGHCECDVVVVVVGGRVVRGRERKAKPRLVRLSDAMRKVLDARGG